MPHSPAQFSGELRQRFSIRLPRLHDPWDVAQNGCLVVLWPSCFCINQVDSGTSQSFPHVEKTSANRVWSTSLALCFVASGLAQRSSGQLATAAVCPCGMAEEQLPHTLCRGVRTCIVERLVHRCTPTGARSLKSPEPSSLQRSLAWSRAWPLALTESKERRPGARSADAVALDP